MKKHILKYLNSQYTFTINTYANFLLYDKTHKTEVGLSRALSELKKIFDISESEMLEIFDAWADEKAIEINNIITDYRYEHFQKTGLELKPEDLGVYNFDDEMFMLRNPKATLHIPPSSNI